MRKLPAMALFAIASACSTTDFGRPTSGDASVDASVDPDAAVVDGGAGDSGGSAGDGGPSFCATHPGHTACFDFDDSPSFPALFERVEELGGTLSLDPLALSLPRALRSNSPARATGPTPRAAGGYTFTKPGFAGKRIECDVRIAPPADVDALLLLLYAQQGATSFYEVGLERMQGRFHLLEYAENPAISKGPTLDPVVPDQWTHIALSVDTADGGLVATARIGQTTATLPLTPHPYVGATQGVASVGIPFVAVNQPQVTVYVDNILIDE